MTDTTPAALTRAQKIDALMGQARAWGTLRKAGHANADAAEQKLLSMLEQVLPAEAQPAFTYTGQDGQALEQAFEGYNYGTAFFTEAPVALTPVSQPDVEAAMARVMPVVRFYRTADGDTEEEVELVLRRELGAATFVVTSVQESLPLSDTEVLAARLGRVAKLAGVPIPRNMGHEQIAEVAGVILGQIALQLERVGVAPQAPAAGATPTYPLSGAEQAVLKRALMRSVNVDDDAAGIPPAVLRWRDAYGAYLAASDAYNARVAAIEARVEQFPLEFGKDDPKAEWDAMETAKRTAFALLQPMFDALQGKVQAAAESLLADVLRHVERYGKEVRRNQVDSRHTPKKHVDAALDQVRAALAVVIEVGGVVPLLAEEQLIAVWQRMPGGPDGWLKEFGPIQFGQEVLKAAAKLVRGPAAQPAVQAG